MYSNCTKTRHGLYIAKIYSKETSKNQDSICLIFKVFSTMKRDKISKEKIKINDVGSKYRFLRMF